jgi:hypothetical protein
MRGRFSFSPAPVDYISEIHTKQTGGGGMKMTLPPGAATGLVPLADAAARVPATLFGPGLSKGRGFGGRD